jgi:glycerol-3-phosphate O-acyltransferase
MDGLTLKERYGESFDQANRHANASMVVDETNVYQEVNPYTRKIMDNIVAENLLSGSRIEGREHFQAFYEQVQAGKRGLILCEHYSNLDLPVFIYLLEHDSGAFGKPLSQDVVAVAGMKLNEENPYVRALAEAYTRIVIYPSRSLAAIDDPQIREREEARSRKINMAAMRALDTIKKNRKPVLVFPSGTRYRPGQPETKRGLREIDSYLRIFDIMILVSINGICLRFNPASPHAMITDLMYRDKIIAAASPLLECKKFRNEVIESLKDDADADPKQVTVDKLMELLEIQHEAYEKIRQQEGNV